MRDYLRGEGIDPSGYEDDKSAAAALMRAAREAQQYRQQLPQFQQWAQYGQQFAAHQQDFQRWLAEQQQPKPAQRPSKPEYDPEWERLVKVDEQGHLIPAHQYVLPDVPQKLEAYRKWQRQTIEGLLDRFHDYDGWKEELLKEMESKAESQAAKVLEYVEQHFGQQQQAGTIQQVIQQNSQWLHVRDQAGNVLLDSRGFPQLSPQGQAYAKAVAELEQSGVTDPVTQDRLARRMIGAQQATPAPTPSPQARQETFLAGALNGAKHQPNRDGTAVADAIDPFNAPLQNPELDFRQMALNDLRSRGVAIP